MKNLLFVVGFLLVGCNTPCSAPGSVASMVSGYVINSWQCQNGEQILNDVSKACAKFGLCTTPARGAKPEGAIANIACPLVVGELQSLVGSQVPTSWECNPKLVGVNFAVGLTALCEMLPL